MSGFSNCKNVGFLAYCPVFVPEIKLCIGGQRLHRSSCQSFLLLSNFDWFLFFAPNLLSRFEVNKELFIISILRFSNIFLLEFFMKSVRNIFNSVYIGKLYSPWNVQKCVTSFDQITKIVFSLTNHINPYLTH